jgi:hypothetical protein
MGTVLAFHTTSVKAQPPFRKMNDKAYVDPPDEVFLQRRETVRRRLPLGREEREERKEEKGRKGKGPGYSPLRHAPEQDEIMH